MRLSINIDKGVTPIKQIVAPAVVVQKARDEEHPYPERAIAITKPYIKTIIAWEDDEDRERSGINEFRHTDIRLLLKLSQTMFIANNLSSCEHDIWVEHEKDHVRDNQRIMGQMNRAIRAHKDLKNKLINPQWHRKLMKPIIHNQIIENIETIFKKLTLDAVKERDTKAVYSQILKKIFQRCPGPFYHWVDRGDSLSKISRLYYGNIRFWETIYRENRQEIGQDSDMITPGQPLFIPKNP